MIPLASALLLDLTNNDLVVDASGNIAMCSTPYTEAQQAASAIKLFLGEYYYNTLEGLPYWESILGYAPPVSYMRQKFVDAALSVNNVVSAKCFISSIEGRKVSGQVQITTVSGQTAAANF